MVLNVVLNSGKVARLGLFLPLELEDIKLYVKKYPRSWIDI